MSESISQSDLRDGYKQVQIGPKSFEIPDEWGINTIPNLCDLGTESFDALNHNKETFEYIDIESVSRGTIDQSKTITVEDAPSRAKQIVSAGDTLVGKVRPYLQAFAPVTEEHDGKVCSTGFAVLSAKEDVSSSYITQAILSKYFLDQMTNRMTGTSYPAVNKSDFENVQLFVPPLHEQHRIADILSTVDEQIQKTDEIITDLRELRRGLRQDMYHAGFTDASIAEHPTIGEYPENWSVAELSAVAEVTMGSSPKSEYYNKEGDGLPFFQGSADFGEKTPAVTTWCSKPNKTASRGDILMSVRAPVGDLNVATEECCIGRGLAGISPIDVDPSYLYGMLKVRKEYLASIASGSTFESINSSELRTLDILVPQIQEQENIGDVLESVTNSYEKEQKYKQSLQELKRGLMQDLLTGKVRVNTD